MTAGDQYFADEKRAHGNAIRIALRAFTRVLNLVASDFEITPAQYRILRNLGNGAGYTQLELARLTGMERPFVSLTIKQLREAGLVTTKTSLDDRRRIDVVLTAKGLKLREQLLTALRPNDRTAAKGVSDRDLSTFHTVLKRMTENMEAYGDDLESKRTARR
jgi:DNA-binding MarR family transcriptional regulator